MNDPSTSLTPSFAPGSMRCGYVIPATGEPCKNPVVLGHTRCHVHHGSRSLRERVKRTELPLQGFYGAHLTEAQQAVYESHIGDTSLYHEAAVAKTLINAAIEQYQEEQTQKTLALLSEEEEGGRKEKERPLRALSTLVQLLERASKIVALAHDQMSEGKKISITLTNLDVEQEVRRQSEQFVRALLGWLPECLCSACRQRVAEELTSRQHIILMTGGE